MHIEGDLLNGLPLRCPVKRKLITTEQTNVAQPNQADEASSPPEESISPHEEVAGLLSPVLDDPLSNKRFKISPSKNLTKELHRSNCRSKKDHLCGPDGQMSNWDITSSSFQGVKAEPQPEQDDNDDDDDITILSTPQQAHQANPLPVVPTK